MELSIGSYSNVRFTDNINVYFLPKKSQAFSLIQLITDCSAVSFLCDLFKRCDSVAPFYLPDREELRKELELSLREAEGNE